MRSTSLKAKQLGVVAVEMAIALPVLVLLMLAVSEIGRMLYQYNTLTKAARDGARFAASEAAFGSSGVIIVDNRAGSRWNQLKTDAANLVVCGFVSCTGNAPVLYGLTTGNVSVDSPDNTHVRISVSYNYQPFLGGPLSMLGFGDPVDVAIPLNATLTMRAL